MTHPAPDPAVVVEDVEDLKAAVVALTAQLGALAGAPPGPGPSSTGPDPVEEGYPPFILLLEGDEYEAELRALAEWVESVLVPGYLGEASQDARWCHQCNPERQQEDLATHLRAAFAVLEERVHAGRLGSYGVATWSGFQEKAFTVQRLDHLAREAAGGDHHLGAIQLPVRLVMDQHFAEALHGTGPITAAAERGWDVHAFAPPARRRTAPPGHPRDRRLHPSRHADPHCLPHSRGVLPRCLESPPRDRKFGTLDRLPRRDPRRDSPRHAPNSPRCTRHPRLAPKHSAWPRPTSTPPRPWAPQPGPRRRGAGKAGPWAARPTTLSTAGAGSASFPRRQRRRAGNSGRALSRPPSPFPPCASRNWSGCTTGRTLRTPTGQN
ncbi:hypothetical protein G3M55_93660 [Streptomyces sp. SID8455]|nr:hypothetical protein [Streptomyces sp. SID8455]